jgi:O-methyltransferase involved in polyketide biosynthesis
VVSEDLTALRAEFPTFRIWREDASGRVRFVARSLRADVNPHTVITADLGELRAAIAPSQVAPARPFSPATPNIARMYDYLLRGKDHLAVDRAAVTRITRRFPEVAAIARANREFQARAVRYVADRGIAQFIDLGAGLPAAPNTHDSAREIAPDARVAYVDHDPVVLAHARALLAVDSQIAVVAADIRDPGAVLADPALTSLIDLTEPVCFLLVSVLHFLPAADADAAVAAFRDRMAPGSYLVISAGTSTGTDPALIRSLQTAYGAATPVTGRAETDIAAWFAGLTLAQPGLTDVLSWRPDRTHLANWAASSRARFLAGVARKPACARDHGTSQLARGDARP